MKISTRLKILMFLPLLLVVSTFVLKFLASTTLDPLFRLERDGYDLVRHMIDMRQLTSESMLNPDNPRPKQQLLSKQQEVEHLIDKIERNAVAPHAMVLAIKQLQEKSKSLYRELTLQLKNQSPPDAGIVRQRQYLATEQFLLTNWDLINNAQSLRDYGNNELRYWYEWFDMLLLALIAAAAILILIVGRLVGRRIRKGLLSLNQAVSMFAASDYSFRLQATETDEVGEIARAFDEMADDVQKANKRFRQVVESAPNAMVMVGQAGRIEMVNTQAEKIFGYARADLLGQTIEILLPERFRGHHPHQRAAFLSDPSPRAMGVGRDLFGRRQDGSEFPIEIGLNPIETEEGAKVLAAIVDISGRKKLEERFRQVESAPNPMVMVGQAGRIEMVNTQAEKIFGYARADLLGQSIEILLPEWFRGHHPHQRATFFTDPSPRAMDVGRDLFGRRQDGSEFPIEIGLNPIETEEGAKVLAAIVDISERVIANQRLTEHREELERSNKELAMFAYVASHDLKSPLRGIAQLSKWIEEDIEQSNHQSIAGHMKLLRSRIQRMENLLDDLLAYSRAGKVEGGLSYVEVGKLVQNLFEMQAPPPGMQLVLGAELPAFTTLSAPFEQVLRNLLSNAIKHHDRADGCIKLSCTANGKDYYEFSISDDGPGIPPQYQERVFGMFQTLRPRDEVEGSGMGLALIKKIVEAYGGQVSIVSDGVRGCCLRFTWPLSIERRLKHEHHA